MLLSILVIISPHSPTLSNVHWAAVDVTLLKSLVISSFDFTIWMLIYWCRSVNVTMLKSLCWCHSLDKNICDWATFTLQEMTDASPNMIMKKTQLVLPVTSTWSLKPCHIWTAGSANKGRHYIQGSMHGPASLLNWPQRFSVWQQCFLEIYWGKQRKYIYSVLFGPSIFPPWFVW